MDKILKNVIIKRFNAQITSIIEIGSGCYGAVSKIALDAYPYYICVKEYFYPKMAVIQAREYAEIKQKTDIPTLNVLSDDGIHSQFNVLITDYKGGENCAFAPVPESKKTKLGANIAGVLTKLHNVTNPFYGYVGDTQYATWAEFYKVRLAEMWKLIRDKNYSNESLQILRSAYVNIDRFPLGCERPSLIHGDFNTSNILIDSKRCEITAVIDPMNMFYGDREYDLFQLGIYNGGDLLIMENYNQLMPVGADFECKLALYKAFGEYYHYSVIGAKEDAHLKSAAADLGRQMEKFKFMLY